MALLFKTSEVSGLDFIYENVLWGGLLWMLEPLGSEEHTFFRPLEEIVWLRETQIFCLWFCGIFPITQHFLTMVFPIIDRLILFRRRVPCQKMRI